jgi:hypothetical protein
VGDHHRVLSILLRLGDRAVQIALTLLVHGIHGRKIKLIDGFVVIAEIPWVCNPGPQDGSDKTIPVVEVIVRVV